ncbi:Replication termination factor 2 [Aphelenchoides besseyi]|nr:Replication termination factor 2 [Aphelenchoides besseyi]
MDYRSLLGIVERTVTVEDAFFQVHNLVRKQPVIKRLFPLTKTMDGLTAPLHDSVYKQLQETLIELANHFQTSQTNDKQNLQSQLTIPYAKYVFHFLAQCLALSAGLITCNRRSVEMILSSCEPHFLFLLTLAQNEQFDYCTRVYAALWSLIGEQPLKSNEKLLDCVLQLLGKRRPDENTQTSRLLQNLLHADNDHRYSAVHTLWAINKRLVESAFALNREFHIPLLDYIDALKATYEADDEGLKEDAVKHLDLLFRYAPSPIIKETPHIFSRLNMSLDHTMIVRMTGRILERFGYFCPIHDALVKHYVERFLSLKNQLSESELEVFGYLLCYAPAQLFDANQLTDVLRTLLADEDELFTNSQWLRAVSFFLARFDLPTKIPIDIAITHLLKQRSWNGRALDEDVRAELEKYLKVDCYRRIDMGADGGTIPKRCELIRKKKEPEKVDKVEANAAKYKTCQLSNQPLKRPIVACRYGRLYNKEAILEGLLNKTLASNELTKHIKGRADFKELQLTENKDYKGDGPTKGNVYIDHNNTKWVCPITALPLNGVTNFTVNFNCGCVISERGIVETKTTDVCLGCNQPFKRDQLVQLYPNDDLLRSYEERLIAEHAAKKTKKAEKKADDARFAKPLLPGTSAVEAVAPKTVKVEGVKAATAGQKRKAEKPLSIQDDPNVSGAVKSLFTSNEAEAKQPKAHWVTFNPLYF